MRVLMLSWEFPPHNVGGIAQHVYDLSTALAASGEEVHLITCADHATPEREVVNGVFVYRVNPYNLPSHDFLTWILQLNLSMIECAVPLINSFRGFDLIHAHDWLVAYAGRVLKHSYHLPLIATIHATEHGRNQGLHNDLQRYISGVEWWLTYESWRVIVCSHYMEQELQQVFQLPKDKIRIVPNGVDLERYVGKELGGFSRELYAAPDEKIVFFVGRLVQEKGVHILLDAVPKVLRFYPKTKFIIAGKGPAEEFLKEKARQMGIYDRVYFTGYIDDCTRDNLYKEASVAVFPSLYEPFGMVVLEAMAAGTPVVAADVGGLSEIIKHENNGLKCYPGNPDSLADNILRLLHDPVLADRLARQAYEDLQKFYTWKEIAAKTREVYREVSREYEESPWKTDVWLEDLENRFLRAGRYDFEEMLAVRRR
jgi:glycogen(starch) synthase